MKVQANQPQRQVIILVAPSQKTDASPSFASSINAAYRNSAQKFGNNGNKLNLMA